VKVWKTIVLELKHQIYAPPLSIKGILLADLQEACQVQNKILLTVYIILDDNSSICYS